MKRISMEEQEEIDRSIELADLVKPHMQGGLDVSLFTKKELECMNKMQTEHDTLFRKRAEELRFYPETMNNKEKGATLRCMTYGELKPYYRIVAIEEKNRRLQNMLAIEKVDIRRYCRMTKQIQKESGIDQLDIPEISIARNTERYFAIMAEHGEKTSEEKYYFLIDEQRTKVMEVYAKSISEVETPHPDRTAIEVVGG